MILILSLRSPHPTICYSLPLFPFTLKHVAISPYHLLLILTGGPSSNIFQILEYLSPQLPLSLSDAYLPRGGIASDTQFEVAFVAGWFCSFPGAGWVPPPAPEEFKSCHFP